MSQFGGNQGTVEVRIPIMQRNISVIEQDFGGHSGQFEDEMRKMETEMGKLTGQINEGNKKIASKVVKTTTTTTTRTSSGGVQGQQPGQLQGGNIPIQHSQPAPGPASVHSQSSHHTTQSHQSNTGSQQPQSIPVNYGNQGSNQQQQQQHYTSSVTTNVGGGNQPQQAPSTFGSNNSSVQRESSHHTTSSHQTYHHSNSGTNLTQTGGNNQLALTNQQSTNQQAQFDAANNQELQQWLGGLDSSLISNRMDTTGQDGKCIRLRFDVSQYRAEEITVKTVDNVLRISAKHEEKSENRSSYREFNKEFSLPIGTDPQLIKSTLSKDGILTVEAPLPGAHALTYGGGHQPQAISNF